MRETICFITSYAGLNIEPLEIFRNDGCYGSEYALFETARRLAKDYNVFITVRKERDYYVRTQEINWIAESDYNRWIKYAKPEHVVVVRFSCAFIENTFPEGAKLYYWLHDPIPLVYWGERTVKKDFMSTLNKHVHKFVSVGNQIIKNSYVPEWGLDGSKFVTIKNGVNVEEKWNPLPVKRKPLSFCFTTTPSRGLWPLLNKGWPLILEKFPEATLDLFYGYNDEDRKKVQEYVAKYPMITIHGKVNQRDLFERYKELEYWLYPCTEQETCCTTCFETAYYGPIQITNKKGALVENTSGFRLEENSRFWQNVVAIIEILETNPSIKTSIRKRQFIYACQNTWDHRAEEWRNLLRS